jgi:hypothetical protein
LVARERKAGWCEVGAFLVDAWCLGVKNAYVDELPAAEFSELLNEQLPVDVREAVEPSCARKVVEGAVAYAQSLGFLPHRGFRKARKVFGSIEPTDCAREFTFGREGRPCFVTGPDDDEARISRVLAILRARLGEEGFAFIDAGDPDAMDAAMDRQIEELSLFIEKGHLPDKDFTTYEAQGFLAGVGLLPELTLPSEWLPLFWGGEARVPVYAGAGEAEMVSTGLMALFNRTLGEIDEEHSSPCFQSPGTGRMSCMRPVDSAPASCALALPAGHAILAARPPRRGAAHPDA